MFVKAIETASTFTRSIHSILRRYKSDFVQPLAASLFFVNQDAWALTCKHVAQQLVAAEEINNKYKAFKNELASRRGQKSDKRLEKELQAKYGYTSQSPVELLNTFVNCIEGQLSLKLQLHPTVDLALLRFDNFSRLLVDKFPIFPADTTALKQGKYLCRLGFPFPEFNNFKYDPSSDNISWTQEGKSSSPQFPIEGMVTRHLISGSDKVGFEMSTPGLRGQSGGPAFDTDGKIWGVQSATAHLDLDFDVDAQVIREGKKKAVQDSAFLHVGHCVHVDIIKAFLREQKVSFIEA